MTSLMGGGRGGSGPLVTGISPKEGPPGTKVTIRGERLGRSQSDIVSLTICDVDVTLTMEWISPNKLFARTIICKGRGDIIVTTVSGGIGSSTVQFRGYQEVVGPMKESAVWVDETLSVGPRPLSMAAYQQEDPLQISVEENDKKFPVDELIEMFPEKSGNLRAENFDPAWFLLENHHATSFEDLKSGLHFLSRKVGSQTEGKVSFLKENMSSVIEQLDSLIALKDKLDRYCRKHGTGFISKIDESIGVSEKEAEKLFMDVLSRKDRADVTRNALSGFQRFRFLFSLPGIMEKSIQRGDYESAISDYARAKALFEQPEIDKPVFRKFRQEIEIRVGKLRDTLKSKLLEKPPNPEEQRAVIGYLVTLECNYDPAWACLKCHSEFLATSMKNCFNQYSEKPKENTKTPSKQDNMTIVPVRVQFIEALSEFLVAYYCEFWNLGQDYFTGKLPLKPDMNNQPEFKEISSRIIQQYSTLVSCCLGLSSGTSSTFIWKDKSEALSDALPSCIPDTKSVFTEALRLECPKETIDILRNLLFSVRCQSLDIMLQQLSSQIAELHHQETWTAEPQGNFGLVTLLPSQYETQVMNTAKIIKESLLQKFSDETPLMKNDKVKARMNENMGNALASFADALELLISRTQGPPSTGPRKPRVKLNLNYSEGALVLKDAHPSESACLLLILNNCSYTTNVILPQIQQSLNKLGFPDMEDVIQKTRRAIKGVENLTFAKYTEMKYEPVVGQIEQSMYAGQFDWEKCPHPTGVRPYITKSLLGMIEVIAEVTSTSEVLVPNVLTRVVENVCEELVRLFSCVAKFSTNGSLQATLDVSAFQDSVSTFLTPESRRLLKETFALIVNSNEVLRTRKVNDLLEDYKRRTRMQFACFVNSSLRSRRQSLGIVN